MLTLVDVPRPVAAARQVLVRVAAFGINRADLLQRRGLYPAPPGVPADIPGLELAGEVVAIGDGVSAWSVGDAVMGVVGGGAYAEYVVMSEEHVVRVPRGMPPSEAAGIPEAFFTAYDAIFARLCLGPYATILVHAAGSGVGTAAVQLAHAAGLECIGTSRSQDKLERAAELGMSAGILTDEQWPQEVLAITGGRGVDGVLDLVGGAYLAKNLRVLVDGGRLVVVGLLAGRSAEIDLGLLLAKRLTLVGTTLRHRPAQEKAKLARDIDARVVPLFDEGRLRVIIDRVFAAREISDAHAYLESNASFGKVVVTWPA